MITQNLEGRGQHPNFGTRFRKTPDYAKVPTAIKPSA